MPMELTDEKPPGAKGELPKWFAKLSTLRGKGPQTMKAIAKHSGTTAANATMMLRPFLNPVGEELSGTRWAETFDDNQSADIGDKWRAGKRWRKLTPTRSTSIEIPIKVEGTEGKVCALLSKRIFSGQTIFFGKWEGSDTTVMLLNNVTAPALSHIVNVMIQRIVEDLPPSDTARSLFCFDTSTPWEKILAIWSIQDGKVMTSFQEISSPLYSLFTDNNMA